MELAWPKRCIKGVHAEVDKNKISQVLRNLVSNALKFTPKGGRVRVTAEVLSAGEYLVICLSFFSHLLNSITFVFVYCRCPSPSRYTQS